MIEGKRIFEYIHDQLAQHPMEKAFGHKVNGQWIYYSTAQMVDWINRASVGLLQLGLRPGDKMATVLYKTSPEWIVLDYAMLQIGVLNVPMYPTISSREYEYILKESGAKYCFVGEGDLYKKVVDARDKALGLTEIFTFYDHPEARPWSVVLAPAGSDLAEVERIKSTIRPDDVATLIYTSGTTGNPKGVMLTHRNIVFNVEAINKLAPIQPGDRCLSFLPVSHVFERVAVYFFTRSNMSVSFTTTENLGGDDGDLKAICPHFFTSVPRLLEKVYERIYAKGLEQKGMRRWLFFWALKLTENWAFDRKYTDWRAFQWQIAHRLIFSKWRAALGGCIKGIITGASACPLGIMRTFNAAGIPIREGYGMTETAPGITFNRFGPGEARLGSVGMLLDGVEIRIEQSPDYRPGEGEILVSGPNVMEGYYEQPEKTAEVIRYLEGKRWMVTGDIGILETAPNGHQFLKITDRKKELLKTSGGKYVAPSPIEMKFKEHHLVEQAMVVGENLKFVSALIVPSATGLQEWCTRHGITWTNLSDAINNPKVRERYQMLVDRINPNFGHAEQIKKFALLPNTWEAVKTDGSEAELTPTLKLKRRVIAKKYAGEIEMMYA